MEADRITELGEGQELVYNNEREAFQKIVVDNWKTLPKEKRRQLTRYRTLFIDKDRSRISNERLISILEEHFGFVIQKIIFKKI